MSGVTINELSKLLNGLIEDGYGDKEFQYIMTLKRHILQFQGKVEF